MEMHLIDPNSKVVSGNGHHNPLFQTPTLINIDNSNDIVIGSVTQFHGPVTILQHQSATTIYNDSSHGDENVTVNNNRSLVKSDSTSSEPGETPTFWFENRKKLLAAVAIIVVLVLTTITVYTINFENLDTAKIFALERTVKLGGHKLITREIWGGSPPLKFTRTLHTPVNYVLISHTAGSYCSSIETCSVVMQNIQTYHISQNSPDIGYNFLIGGDGNIYVGRGWDIVNFHTNGCIGISFMGNYLYEELSDSMIEATKMLLGQGVVLGKLTEDYYLIAHNQTYATVSPGPNVYKEIKKWKHFLPGTKISWECTDCNA